MAGRALRSQGISYFGPRPLSLHTWPPAALVSSMGLLPSGGWGGEAAGGLSLGMAAGEQLWAGIGQSVADLVVKKKRRASTQNSPVPWEVCSPLCRFEWLSNVFAPQL